MHKAIIKGISSAIRSVLTEPVPIRIDDLEQSPNEGAYFFIQLLNANPLMTMYKKTIYRYHFVVNFYPKDYNTENSILLMQGANALTRALTTININGKRRKGIDIRAETSDGILLVFVSYDLALTEEEVKILVKHLEQERTV